MQYGYKGISKPRLPPSSRQRMLLTPACVEVSACFKAQCERFWSDFAKTENEAPLRDGRDSLTSTRVMSRTRYPSSGSSPAADEDRRLKPT